jgi:hypothetical protein
MSITPAVPIAAPTVTQTWLQKHERIIIVALILAVGTFGLSRYFDATAAKAEARATAAEQALVLQKATDAQNAATVASVLAQYQAMVQADHTLIASLAAAAAQRQAAVVQQQHTDATLPAADLANRLKTLGNAPEGSISVSGDTLNLLRPGAVAIVQALETIPALQADLKDTQVALGSSQAALAQAGTVITAQTTEITGLKKEIADQAAADKAEIAAVKAAGRKNSMKWFLRGVVVGYIGGLLSH